MIDILVIKIKSLLLEATIPRTDHQQFIDLSLKTIFGFAPTTAIA